jgi:hypothetical protein
MRSRKTGLPVDLAAELQHFYTILAPMAQTQCEAETQDAALKAAALHLNL